MVILLRFWDLVKKFEGGGRGHEEMSNDVREKISGSGCCCSGVCEVTKPELK